MAIPVMNFAPPMVPQQPDSLTTGLNAGLNMYTQLLKAFAMPKQMEAQQAQQQAALEQTQAQTGLTGAETERTQAQTADMPMQDAFSAMRLQQGYAGLDQSQSRFGPVYQMQKFASTPEGQKALADNPEMAQNYLQAMADKSNQLGDQTKSSQYAPQQALLQQLIQKGVPGSETNMQPNTAIQMGSTPSVPPVPQAFPQFSVGSDGKTFKDSSGNPVPLSALPQDVRQAANQVTKAQIQSFQDAAQDSFEKKTNVSNTLVQRKAVTSLVNTMEEAKKHLPGYLKFVDASRKAGMITTKFAAALGKNDPNFNDYNIMTTTIFPTMNGEYRKMVGGQASDKEMAFINDIISPDQWWYNPDAALAKMNSVYETTQGFAKSLSASQTDTQRQLSKIASSDSEFFQKPGQESMTVSPEDQEKLQSAGVGLAQKLGLSKGTDKIQIPSFGSKQEFQSWYASQSPQAKAAIKQQLGGQ